MPDILQIIADPRRQEILRLVWDDDVVAGDIARAMPEVTFGAVSQHLRVLREAGLVDMHKDGRFRVYRANRAALRPFANILAATWSTHLLELKALAEADERRSPRKRRR